MRSARLSTKADYHYWLGIAIVTVALLWSFVDARAEAVPINLPDAPHTFVNKTNVAIWTADATSKALDGYSTARNLAGGGRENDPIARPFVHGAASQAAYFGLSFAGDVGFAYLMHRAGHHRLEKIIPMIAFGQSLGCAVSNLRKPLPKAAPNTYKIPSVKEKI